jgi:hypothetical protein
MCMTNIAYEVKDYFIKCNKSPPFIVIYLTRAAVFPGADISSLDDYYHISMTFPRSCRCSVR